MHSLTKNSVNGNCVTISGGGNMLDIWDEKQPLEYSWWDIEIELWKHGLVRLMRIHLQFDL